MIDYVALQSELTVDPLGRGYAAMTDQEAADDLNTIYRTTPVEIISGGDVLNATDDTEYNAITAEQHALEQYLLPSPGFCLDPTQWMNIGFLGGFLSSPFFNIFSRSSVEMTPGTSPHPYSPGLGS